ncbi:unnamed protein product [Chilo suppressalis]|uniref:THAP-type domain-containing protein n=1 Tax=Chilo suppressalis TaxID=168631 RepID=A0ABN8LAG1_CHISP|nr:unnamed protein product [Chilo suppressalis]
MSDYAPYRWCAVPECKNTSKRTPDKLWMQVPNDNLNMRKAWLSLAGRDPEEQTRLYFCEDHFNLEQDMENFKQYKVIGSVKRVRLKPDCIPSRFDKKNKSACLFDAKDAVQNQKNNDDNSKQLLVCRGCFATGVKLFDLQPMNLKDTFEEFVGKTNTEMALHLCSYCAALLLKFTQFRERCRRTENLMQMLHNIKLFNKHTVNSIDRTFYKLNLDFKISELTFIETDIVSENKEDTKSTKQEDIELSKDLVEIKREIVTNEDSFKADLDISDLHHSIDLKEEHLYTEDSLDVRENIGLGNDKVEIKEENATNASELKNMKTLVNSSTENIVISYINGSVDNKQEYDTEMRCNEKSVRNIENDEDNRMEQLLKCLPKNRDSNGAACKGAPCSLKVYWLNID